MPHSEVNFNDNFDGNSQQQKLLASEFGAKTSSANNDDEIKRIKLDLDEVEEDFTVDSSSTSKMLQTLLQSLSASGTDNFVENFLKAENQSNQFNNDSSSTNILSLADNFFNVNNNQNKTRGDLTTANFPCSSEIMDFPRPLDYSQPGKSWWRYYGKVTLTNTAICLTCGQSFNRGPKQSTTSLSHHLKMYHRDLFIEIQQAKDAEFRINGNPRFNGALAANARKSMQNQMTASASQNTQSLLENRSNFDVEIESPGIKKTSQNIILIRLVRQYPELYDPKIMKTTTNNNTSTDIEELKKFSWSDISKAMDGDLTADMCKKRWLQIRDRYRKELKFAIRDNFAYIPKWPYFKEMNWFDEFITDFSGNITGYPTISSTQRKRSSDDTLISNNSGCSGGSNFSSIGNNLPLLNLFDDSNLLLNNLLSACANEASSSADGNDPKLSPDSASSEDIGDAKDSTVNNNNNPEEKFILAQKETKNFVEKIFKNSQNILNTITNSEQHPNRRATSFKWLNDEDLLFGKIVALRLKNLNDAKKKQTIKIAIEQLFELQERTDLIK